MGWEFWWGYNKHRLIDLRKHLFQADVISGDDRYSLGEGERNVIQNDRIPNPETIRSQVVPYMLELLQREEEREIVSSILIALAKLSHAGYLAEARVVELVRPFLKDGNRLVAESAVMAYGVLASPKGLDDLQALLADSQDGQRLVGSSVPTRMRALAAVSLGLVGEAQVDASVRVRVVGSLARVFDGGEHFGRHDIPVAAMAAMALVPLPRQQVRARDLRAALGDSLGNAPTSRASQMALVRGIAADRGRNASNPTLRAHAVRALGRLTADVRGEPRHRTQELLHSMLKPRGGDTEQVQVAAIQTLGFLADSDDDKADRKSRKVILAQVRDGTPLVRRLARIAAARVAAREGTGTDPVGGRSELQRSLVMGLSRAKSREKSWCALALGILCHADLQAGQPVDRNLVAALRTAGRKERGPLDVGAYAIALGLARDLDSVDFLLRRYEATAAEIPAGQLALGIGLIGDKSAAQVLLPNLESSRFRATRLLNTALGLGLLSERQATPLLVGLVESAGNMTSQSAAALAVGWIGDGRAVEPLLALLRGKLRSDHSAAYAIVALGRIGAARDLPWNTTLSEDVPYTSMTETLIDGQGGVLDVF